MLGGRGRNRRCEKDRARAGMPAYPVDLWCRQARIEEDGPSPEAHNGKVGDGQRGRVLADDSDTVAGRQTSRPEEGPSRLLDGFAQGGPGEHYGGILHDDAARVLFAQTAHKVLDAARPILSHGSSFQGIAPAAERQR
jgi:hypothetical protein